MLSCLSHTLAFGLPSRMLRSTRQIELEKQSARRMRPGATTQGLPLRPRTGSGKCRIDSFGMNRLARSPSVQIEDGRGAMHSRV